MKSESAVQRIVVGGLILMALFGFFGCAKKTYVSPGPEDVEIVDTDRFVAEPRAPVARDAEEVLTERTLRAEAREQLQVRLQDIHFDFDRYSIRPQDRQILKRNFELLMGMPGVEVLIEGHCDERGTVEYNLALGQRRANATRDYMISLGLDPAQVSTISYGEERPLDPRSNEDAWAKNRRCHFVVLKP